MNARTESRIPNSEPNPNFEIRNLTSAGTPGTVAGRRRQLSVFGLRHWFGPRISAFGISALALLTATFAPAQSPAPDNVQTPATFTVTVTQTVQYDYLLFLPKDYDADPAKKWPLMMFLHGAGERGTNLWLVAVHGPPKLVRSQPDFPFILVSPQCPPEQHWNPEALAKLLDQLETTHRVDKSRVYLTGLSMGGFGTWSLGVRYPERFAAIAPICGGGSWLEVRLSSRSRGAALKSLPVWAFHGAKDNVVPLSESERMIDVLKTATGNENTRLTVYPDANHDSWTETYNNPELFKWLLEHRREGRN
jgi:predicted peptidase